MGFRCLMRRDCRRFVNNQSTGTLASPSASSTVVLPVHTGPGPRPTNITAVVYEYIEYFYEHDES